MTTNELPQLTKFQNRFVVVHPRFPSYIINGYAIGLDELRLKFYIEESRDVIDFYKREMVEQIEIVWLNQNGKEMDHIKFNRCRVKEVNCIGDWSFDNPTEAVIVYEVGTMGKRQ
jgi:hypothetical protein